MSKIVKAVNSMIVNRDEISNVRANGDEFFFEYRHTYVWSITKRDEAYLLWYYPGNPSIDMLQDVNGPDWEDVAMVKYTTEEIGTKEAKSSFAELYSVVKERLYGIDDVLDDIISDTPPF